MIILIAGDFCPQYRVAEKFEMGDYDSVLGEVKSIISDADYSIVNFECPVTIGGEKPIEKCGPSLKCSEKGIEAVKWVGFDCVTLSNNHFLDYGKEGVERTIEACERYGIDTVGGGRNLQEASKIFYKEVEGKTLAVINCCEHEFSIATKETAGSNPLNPIQQFYAIKEARTQADFVLVVVHGGNEYYQLPSPRMKETYRFFIDAGADAVVNHHQHCYSGYEYYNDKPIVYGLGNFCFDVNGNNNKSWTAGYMVEIDLGDRILLKLIPYNQCGEMAAIRLMCSDEHKEFMESITRLNQIIIDDRKLSVEYDVFLKNTHSNIELLFSPYSTRIGRALCLRKILPSFMNKFKKREYLGFLQCESHLPKIMNYLKNK